VGPGEEDEELLKVLDALAADKSVREVALGVLGADATRLWDPDGGERSKAKRRIEKATALMKGGYRAFLEPGPERRQRRRKASAGPA